MIDIQDRNQADLLNQKGIAGVGTGLDDDGNVVIKVYTTGADSPKIPAKIENVTVIEVLTGPIHPYQIVLPPVRKRLLPRPVPIGVSAIYDPGKGASQGDCASATVGCRLRDTNTGILYALSNNHVWAHENRKPIGTPALQPSPGDDVNPTTGVCDYGIPNHSIGTLAAFVPLQFSGPDNTVDCAIIKTTANFVNTSTLSDGYGVPTSKNVPAFLDQVVQKYGRTTGYTRGVVKGLNVSVTVGYSSGAANFIKQIEVDGDEGFASLGAPGDSGSLVVDMNRNPVGILFGGGAGQTFVNQIDLVLQALDAQLDSTLGNPKGAKLVIDSSPPTATGKEMRSLPNSP